MKLTKILSSVACFALVGAFMFTSCDGNIGSDDIVVTEGGAKASINAENTGVGEFRRTLAKSSTFSKKEVTSTITFENQTSSSNNGAMGLAFDYHSKEDSDGDTVYDFGVVAFKFVDGKLCTYISYYSDVGADYLSGSTDNFCDKKGIKIGVSGCLAKEYKVIPENSSENWYPAVNKGKVSTDSLKDYYTYDSDKGTVTVVVNVAVQEDGSFVVKIAKDVASLSTDDGSYTVAQKVDNYYATSVTEGKAVKFAYYANVYGASSADVSNTLKGNWSTSF